MPAPKFIYTVTDTKTGIVEKFTNVNCVADYCGITFETVKSAIKQKRPANKRFVIERDAVTKPKLSAEDAACLEEFGMKKDEYDERTKDMSSEERDRFDNIQRYHMLCRNNRKSGAWLEYGNMVENLPHCD